MIFIGPNGEYPRYEGDILLINPEWNSRKKLPQNWERVFETEKPEKSSGGVAIEDTPERQEDGKLYQRWKIVSQPAVLDMVSLRPENNPV